MTIKHWAEFLRPREKLLAHGPQRLSDPELLAVLLRTGHRGRNAVQLAQHLIEHFGGLRGLLEADAERCRPVPGLGPAKIAQLQAVMELARRCLATTLERQPALHSPAAASDYLRAALRHQPHECFMVLFMDTQHRVLACEELFRGTIDRAQVYPREIVRRILQHNAAAVILAHNHPSGLAEPSAADIELTRRIKEILMPIDTRVLDHLIVGESAVVSLAERGLA